MKNLYEYAVSITDNELPVLQEIRRETNLKVLMPRMLSGHYQGVLLQMFSKMISPKNILEVGTFTGYSAICLAQGLHENGQLLTLEYNDELEIYIKKNIKKANLSQKISYKIGDATQIIQNLQQKFDLVFIDADKRQYLKYYHAVFSKVKIGGFILADNVFWDGKVLEPVAKNDLYTKGVVDFNNFVKNDNRVEKVTIPIRDGLTVIRKILES